MFRLDDQNIFMLILANFNLMTNECSSRTGDMVDKNTSDTKKAYKKKNPTTRL